MNKNKTTFGYRTTPYRWGGNRDDKKVEKSTKKEEFEK